MGHSSKSYTLIHTWSREKTLFFALLYYRFSQDLLHVLYYTIHMTFMKNALIRNRQWLHLKNVLMQARKFNLITSSVTMNKLIINRGKTGKPIKITCIDVDESVQDDH